MKMRRIRSFPLLVLLLLILAIPIMAFAEDETMIVQEIAVSNTPIKGTIEIDKWGFVLKGFSENRDTLGYTVHTPLYQEDWLPGAVYEVRAREDIVGKDQTVWFREGELVATMTTTADGSVVTEPLPLGRYIVTEVSAPAGYVLDETRHEIALTASDHTTPVVKARLSAVNEFMAARITLTKEKEIVTTQHDEDGRVHSRLMNVPGEGFVFGLYSSDPIEYAGGTLPADTLIETGITDTDGVLTFSGDYPHGEYDVQELAAPEGWVLSDARYRVTISDEFADEHHDVVFQMGLPIHNEIVHADVRIAKTDKTGDATLSGALIEVRNSEGEIICRDYTGEDGYLPALPAVPGTYTYREVLAPEGYALDDTEMTFTINEQGEVVGQTTIADEFSRFSIRKVDPQHRPLEGVEYGLFREDGTLHSTAVTDSEGLAAFERIPYGSYTIEEIKQLPGYVKDHTKTPITVDGTFKNPDAPIATLTNCPTELLVQKVDQNSVALAGAQFGLFDEKDELVMTAVSDAEGLVHFVGAAVGKYTICELAAPDGYLLSKDVIHVTIDEGYTNNDVPLATVVNQLKKITCIKVDTAGTPMSGIAFSLYKASTMEKVETAVSNQDGVFTFSQFDYGDWIIREDAAPNGYCRTEDIRIHVGDDWTEPKPIMCVNIPNHYEFIKTDSSGVPLAGAKFTVEDASGRIIGTYESGEDGIVSIRDLEPGEYFIKETETLEGYSVSGEVIRVKINEAYVVSDEMRRFVNYTTIQTGVNLAVTGVMWVGIGLMVISGTAGLIRKRRSSRNNRNN